MRITIELESRDLNVIKSVLEAINCHAKNLDALEDLGLTEHARRCLQAEQIFNIDTLCRLTENDVLKIPNLGRKYLNDIKEKLSERGLSLAAM